MQCCTGPVDTIVQCSAARNYKSKVCRHGQSTATYDRLTQWVRLRGGGPTVRRDDFGCAPLRLSHTHPVRPTLRQRLRQSHNLRRRPRHRTAATTTGALAPLAPRMHTTRAGVGARTCAQWRSVDAAPLRTAPMERASHRWCAKQCAPCDTWRNIAQAHRSLDHTLARVNAAAMASEDSRLQRMRVEVGLRVMPTKVRVDVNLHRPAGMTERNATNGIRSTRAQR